MEYYSAVTKKEVMPFVVTWMDLEIIILSEVSLTKTKYVKNITYMWNLKKMYTQTYLQSRNRCTGIENKLRVTKGEVGGGIN